MSDEESAKGTLRAMEQRLEELADAWHYERQRLLCGDADPDLLMERYLDLCRAELLQGWKVRRAKREIGLPV